VIEKAAIREALATAFPMMLGYAAIGIPCGILSAEVGMNAVQVFLFSALFYSGVGQFMVSNMWLAGMPAASIAASVSLISTRQVLYSASLAQFCQGLGKGAAFLFAATVTDEGYGVNIRKFQEGGWSIGKAMAVNFLLLASWVVPTVIGALIGAVVDIPLAIASFAMTSVFIFLLVTQKLSVENAVAAAAAVVAVVAYKAAGLPGPTALVGASAGVLAAAFMMWVKGK